MELNANASALDHCNPAKGIDQNVRPPIFESRAMRDYRMVMHVLSFTKRIRPRDRGCWRKSNSKLAVLLMLHSAIPVGLQTSSSQLVWLFADLFLVHPLER